MCVSGTENDGVNRWMDASNKKMVSGACPKFLKIHDCLLRTDTHSLFEDT
jgi:hypothetical protein